MMGFYDVYDVNQRTLEPVSLLGDFQKYFWAILK